MAAVCLIVMGVSGSGKTTVGQLLAQRLGAVFLDADDFHPPENVAKMRRGEPLTDADRAGWLAALAARLAAEAAAEAPCVLACSALKQSYRDALDASGAAIRWVYLRGDYPEIAARLAARHGHFMPASLLQSQFAALEEPKDAIVVAVGLEPEQIVDRVLEALA